jgi:putative endonuclease
MKRDRKAAEQAGRRAETLVALYLQLTGHRILARRYRCASGEIDLIARRGRTIVFVEVKQRRRAEHAIEPVTARSEERILRSGETWLNRHPRYIEDGFGIRYDLITVIGTLRILHQRDVFRGW